MKWRWQPQDCEIPRNQWESMLCMSMGAIKDSNKVYVTHRRRITKEKGNYSFRFVLILLITGLQVYC
ncbi:putative trichome birefringence-like family [Rosa chinensis]|uniref:Putative trichome birefringence-like family n=1 Tax=Rosa chinensis TaxID=74649 RepID=A0A2P6QL13_ROSCH|nr:putative trichome birefringence-like family [Rosa chinensis]